MLKMLKVRNKKAEGQGLVEYALIIAFIAVVVIVSMLFLRNQITAALSGEKPPQRPPIVRVYKMTPDAARTFCVAGCEDTTVLQDGQAVILDDPACDIVLNFPKGSYQATGVYTTRTSTNVTADAGTPHENICSAHVYYTVTPNGGE